MPSHDAYLTARAEAQQRANATGRDIGLEYNRLFHSWHNFLLPNEGNRYGHELRCEVVRPERVAQ